MMRKLLKQVCAPDQVLGIGKAEFGHPIADILCEHVKDADDTFWRAFFFKWPERFKAFSGCFFFGLDVCSDANMTCAVLTTTTDRAANSNHRHSAKSNAIRTQAQHLDDITTTFHATIDPQLDVITQLTTDQRSVCQPYANFRRQTNVP